MRKLTETEWVEYGHYADAMADDARAGKRFPVNSAEWIRREDLLRGDQLTLETDELASGTNP